MKSLHHTWLPMLLVIIGLQFSGHSAAAVESVQFEDPVQEELYQEMLRELRCLVCQNQNLADSNAELAQDLRNKTRELVLEGKDRSDIVEFMVARYGEFVLYRPRFSAATAFLWISPVVLFLFVLWLVHRWRRNVNARSDGFTEEDLERARSMLRRSDSSTDSRPAESRE